MLIPPHLLKDLRAGRRVEVALPREQDEPEEGSRQTVYRKPTSEPDPAPPERVTVLSVREALLHELDDPKLHLWWRKQYKQGPVNAEGEPFPQAPPVAVWVAEVELVREERPRFLGRRGGYVEDPAAGLEEEPQAVPRDVQREISDDAEDEDRRRRRQAQRESFARDLERERARALEAGVDIRPQERLIQRAIDAMRRKADEREAA